MDKKANYQSLLSTQVLPLGQLLDLAKAYQGKKVVCKGCQKSFILPPGMKKGHVKCQTCGALYQVGVPSQYVLIHCICGKLLTAQKKEEGKKGRCPGCGKSLQVPLNISKEEKRIVKVGIPDNMVRIACPCGKILTTPKEYLGRKGRCPGCSRILSIIENPQTMAEPKGLQEQEKKENSLLNQETKTQPALVASTHPVQPMKEELNFAGPIHFKCVCGQPHLVESYRVKEKMICFRCNREIVVPSPSGQVSSATEQQPLTHAIEVWHIQTPYPEENFFAYLDLKPDASFQEIKEACHKIQSQSKRHDEKFQKAQMMKDTLSHPEKRLRYEIFQEELVLCWKGLAPRKSLKIHDIAIQQHKQAIGWESQKRNYAKADPLWQKAMQNFLVLQKDDSFWEGAKKRGRMLFEKKFQDTTIDNLRESILKDTLISVSTQFYERYSAEKNSIRAHCHKKFLLPVIQYLSLNKAQDNSIRSILLEYYYEEIEILIQASSYNQALDVLLEAKNLFLYEKEIDHWIEIFSPLLLPFLSPGRKAKLEAAR
ncbi:MAG: hypothetical protein HUU50_07620 [Candidatus Brocadiae bacterium]|nr:hypothetical protein [Candidatus Brocadiia bacterium]